MSNAQPTDNLAINQYKLVNCLASGQHSQVWEAIDNETTRRVAMKLLLPESLKDPEQLASLKSEFRIGSSFEHPNIIKYHEISVKRAHAFFTMDLFAAPNLKAWVHNDFRGIHIRFKRFVESTAMALEQIHERGWVHRDIKPDNILMNKSAEVRIIDFSLSCRAAGALSKVFARKQATVKGTRTYMAPEQIMGKPLTPQTDIYNFGVTLFELLTGQAPFAGSTPKDLLLRHIGEIPPEPSSINTNITPEMDRVILKMIAKKPVQRHKSMAELLVELRNVSPFKEAVVEEVEKTEEEKAQATLQNVIGGALDSRADALRTMLGVAAPQSPRKKKPPPAVSAAAQPPSAAGARPPAPVAAGPMPGQYLPGQMMPGMMPPPPMYPYPMQPVPGMQMPYPMAPGPMPQPAQPAMPMPVGSTPWVAVPQAPAGRPVAPPASGAVPPPAAIPQAARPLPPPVAAAAVPPVVPKPAPAAAAPKPVVARPVPAKPAATAPAAKSDEGMRIDDLLGFDDLPSAR